MKINTSGPAYRAKLITTKTPKYISKYNEKIPVSFVKIDSGDLEALETVTDYWVDGKLCKNIYYAAESISNGDKNYKNNEVYALTSQNSNFDSLDYEKILGLANICKFDNSGILIEQIEASPQNTYSISPIYRGIGTAMLDSMKELFQRISCFPSKSEYVKNFYIHNGFVEHPDKSNHYLWEKA